MVVEIILIISVLLQIVAAFLALRLIKLTDGRAAWILIASGLVLMAVGRFIDILPFLSVTITPEVILLNEWISFFISIVMVAGVALIAPVFYAIRRSEKALRESEEKYRTLLENVNVGVYRNTGDPEGRFIQANPAMAEIFGYESLEQFMNVPVSGLYGDPEERKKFIEKIKKMGSVKSEELILYKRDGTPIKASVTANVKYDERGEIEWIDGVIEDITERKQVEEKLRESEERYRLLIETMNEGLGMVDNKGIRTFVNKKFCEMTGYSKEELIGYPAVKLYVEEENQKIFLQQRINREKGADDPYEIVLTSKDGDKIQVLVSPKPVYDKNGQYVGSIATFTDITDRKQVEEKLRESEQRLHRVIQGSPIPAFVIGKDHKVIDWNKALEELTGIKSADVVGTTQQWRAFYSEERPCMADLLVDGVLGDIPKWYEGMYIKSKLIDEAYEATDFFPALGDGGKWLRFTAAVIRGSSGEVVGAIETLEDVTDRRKAEAYIRESEEKYRSLATTADSMYMIDRDFRYILMNERYLSRFGLPLEKIIGRAYEEFHSKEATREFVEIVERVFETGASIQHEYRSERDGLYFLRTFSPVKSSDEEVIKAVTVVSKDITDRKQVEEKLRESEQRLHRVIQGSPIPAFVIGKDHKVIDWNKALEELTGIKSADVVGTTQQWRAFYSEERPCMADLLVDGVLGDIPKWYEGMYIKSKLIDEAYEATDFFPALGDGGKWLRFTAAVIRGSSGEVVGAIETLEDVTDRKKAEEELIKVEKLESLGIFASGIAHDFSRLLSAMLRNIFSAKLTLTEGDKALEEELVIAEKVGLQAKELAYRLVTFAKGGEPTRRVGSISQLLRETADLSLSGSNITCKFLLPDDLWSVEVDDVQMRQVVDNLLINAQEAMPDGGKIIIRAENVDVTAGSSLPLKEGKYVRWSVKDHGKGMPKDDLPRIFDPYFTTKPSGTSKGVGLGLAICYSIVTKHDGFIAVESEPRAGTTFTVYLPASSESVIKDEAEKTSLREGKILVMDDEESVRNATGIVLNYLGYEVEYAQDGIEAIDLYKKAREKARPFSAVILDLHVPAGMGGKETMKELLAIDPSVKAIISCRYSDDHVISEFRKYGFSGAVNVPYDMETIKETLKQLLK
jgi:PAS domain S-box-containing protein